MKITGLTIIRNAILNDYPIVEAITSILPVVDEMIVSLDKGEDDTEQLIRSISSSKIKIIYSTWDMSLRHGGVVLAVETNKAMAHVSADTDWIFYIQADEAVHEKYHATIKAAAEKYANDKNVEGLLFNYLHFYGTYKYVGDSRKWYAHEVRMIKNDKRITSYRDAQGFRVGEEKIKVVPIDAYIYHYGWVKSPKQMKEKQVNVVRFWSADDEGIEHYKTSSDIFNFNDFDSLKIFSGTHPQPMEIRVKNQNWTVDLDVTKKKMSLKNRLLYWIEKQTGKRLFEFRNYKIVK